MTPVDMAMRYMEIFFSGKDPERLHEVVSEDLEFLGPFFRFDSARAYVQSLMDDPPLDCSYRLLHTFHSGSAVNLIYEFRRPGIVAMMSQLFEIREDRIERIVLIFDTADFS